MELGEQPVSSFNKENLPRHVAIIMDGNGRWAKEKGLPRIAGHWSGAEALRRVLEYCAKIEIEVLSVFAFSSENWKRPLQEVSAILNLLLYYLKVEAKSLHKNNVKITFTGDWEELPQKIADEIKACKEMTRDNTGIILNIALNYGSRREIVKACKKLCQNVKDGVIKLQNIDENIFEKFLYTSDIPDPDLLIRPSGELRISNFLLWQIAYSELWFTDTYWPDFTPEDISKALDDYRRRERRFGGLNK